MTWISLSSLDGNQIQNGQTLNSGNISQSTNHWYVTASDGDVVARVFPGMSFGETETGELSLDGSDAMLSLSIGRDELLVLFALDGGELESGDGESRGRRHLAFDCAGQIELPNNVLRVDKGIRCEATINAPTTLHAVWRPVAPENQTSPTGNIDAASHKSIGTEQSGLPKVPGKTSSGDNKRQRVILSTASAGVLCVLLGFLYTGLPTAPTPEQAAPIARQVAGVEASGQTAQTGQVAEIAEVAEVAEIAEIAETSIAAPTAVLPSRDQIRAEGVGESVPILREPVATPEGWEKTAVIAVPTSEGIASDTTPVPVTLSTQLVSQNRSTPEGAERDVPSSTTATRQSTRSRPTVRNPLSGREFAEAAPEAADATVSLAEATPVEAERAAAEVATTAESPRTEEQAQSALLIYERDLLAAKLALAQGRLTQPPEDNAYALYKKLVASNPESSEVRRGFKALGAALVNRAFAELAAKRWSDARATLAAAAAAGGSPDLVADLRGEVDYQQRLADAEAGRFAALYPAAELVALNRRTSRLRRYAPDGMDEVQIEFTVSVEGTVQDIELLDAAPQRLERVVRQSVTDWRFEPVLSGTRPIPVRTRFALEIN